MWQLLQAVSYLHRHCIGHRDVSLENVLLKDGVVRVMDFGMAVRSRSASGTPLRYFRAVGKDFYRAPECYVPAMTEARITAPVTSKPGDVVLARIGTSCLAEVRLPQDAQPGLSCYAEVWGYTVPPADLFACGVCLFILSWQCPPWHKATLADHSFDYLHGKGNQGLDGLLQSWRKTPIAPAAMELLCGLLQADPAKRPSMDECLASPWFAEFHDQPVPTHNEQEKEAERVVSGGRLSASAGA
jgi:serine/threonine protein kinase